LEFIAGLLREIGYRVTRISPRKRYLYLHEILRNDIIYGEYIMNAARLMQVAKALRKRTVMHVIGSDAFRFSQEKYSWRWPNWALGLGMTDRVLYADGNLAKLVGFEGYVLPYPIDTRSFTKQSYSGQKRDILYYVPNGSTTYKPEWIVSYANANPSKKITILGKLKSHAIPNNIEVDSLVERTSMPDVYARHRQLIRMTTHDAVYPRMLYEALRCGLEVVWNGKTVREEPPEIMPEYFVRKFSEYVLE
jgi:hypothetical protein